MEYVVIGKVPENLFWFADISFIEGLRLNKNTYDKWLSYEENKLRERMRRNG